MRVNTMSLGKRVLSRAALLAPATVLCLASATSMAAVIDSGPLNINVVPNIDGLYVNFVTGANANGTIAGWDFNPYQTGTFLTFFTSAAAANTNSVVGAAGTITALAPGATIGPASSFATTGIVSTAGTAFRATGTAFVGVRFTRESDSTVHYGYAEMTTTTGTGFPAVLVRYAYDDTPNTPITIPLGVAAPIFAYTPPAASTVAFTGGTTIGSTGNGSIAVAIGTPGAGTGAAATTTTTCTPPTAPFAGFGQTVTAEGVGAITGSPLTGTCTLGAAVATQTLTCSENRGGTPTAVTFTLSCPAGTAVPLTSTPASGSTITMPAFTLGGAATTSPVAFQNPGLVDATVTCTAPAATEFTVAPLSIPVAAGGSGSTTISFSTAVAGTFNGTLTCTAGAQTFTFNLTGTGSATPLTSTPVSGSTVTLPNYTVGGAPTTAPIAFQNPGLVAATITCTAPMSTQFTVSPLSIPVPAGGSGSTLVTFSTPVAGTFTTALTCSAGQQSFTFNLSGSGTAQLVAVPTLDHWGRLLLVLLALGVAAPLLLTRRS